MATVIVEMAAAGLSRSGVPMPAFSGKNGVAESVTTSGTSAQTTITAQAGFYVTLFNADASQIVWGAIGQSPTAASGSGFALGPGERRDFGPVASGDKIALING